MAKITISYRRSDSAGMAGRIFDRLTARYGPNTVFIDIDNIPFGVDFRQHIQRQIAETNVMLAIIGPRWLGEQTSHSRLMEENDPVRVEIETAMLRSTVVIPILVDHATMPSPGDLPDPMRDFAYLNAAEVDAGRDFQVHIARLIDAVDKILAEQTAAMAARNATSATERVEPPAPPQRTKAPSTIIEKPERSSTGSAITIAARLDRLPASPHTRKLITLLSLGGWFEFYDLFFTAYVALGLFKAGIFKPTTAGLFDLQGLASFVAALFAGLFVGTIAFSWLSDRFGRRSIFTFALLWYSVGAFIMAFQNSPQSVDLWRFIASVGLGVELVNVDTYVSELVPKGQRGPAFAYNQFVMFTAVPIVAFLAWQLVPLKIFGFDGWRWVVIIGSIGALVIWWIRRNLPESPRWLAQHGRVAEAEKIVADWEQKIRADGGAELPPPEIVAGEAEVKVGAWSEMWNTAYRGRTIMLVIYNLFQTIGYYGFSSWVPTLLISQGVATTRSLGYTFIIAVAAPIGPLIGVFFADHFERKWQIAWAAVGIAVFGLLFAWQSSVAGVVICGLLITLCNNWLSFSFHAYQAELYPTRIRAQAVGFVYSWSRFSAIFSGFIIAFFLGHYGTIGVFGFIAGAMAVVFVVIGGFGPPVTKRRLEAIAA